MVDETPRLPKFRYQDIPDLPETFADSIGSWFFDGQTLRIEFTVSRLDPQPEGRDPAEPASGRRLPVCRLVLSASATADLMKISRQFAAAMEKGSAMLKQQLAAAKEAATKSAERAAGD
jgi:hypothetical protein